ncbi:cadherin-like domain-containing protein [Promicromonospora sp. NPDC019610]|uniref:cadherin-like domain-containing protein n=1 Tax=Promicromonospora sp. NPDC019610 TaxID=3364405 RepID=UPI003798AEB5
MQRIRTIGRAVAGVGLCTGLALTAGALPASADPGTGDGTTTNLLYSVDGGAWTDSPVAQRGDTVVARLFYDTTREDALTGVSLTSQLPDGFAYVAGSTRNVLAPGTDVLTGAVSTETKESPVADSVWDGDTITVSPSAGFLGEPTGSQAGFLRNGVQRYLNLHECQYYSAQNNDYYNNVVDAGGAFRAGTNASNTADASSDCGPGGPNYPLMPISSVQNIDLLGNRYVNLHQCQYVNRTTSDYYNTWAKSGVYATGTGSGNNADTAADCGPGTTTWDPVEDWSFAQALDLVDNRWLNLHQCQYYRADSTDYYSGLVNMGPATFRSGTNASNTADSAYDCGPASGPWELSTRWSFASPLDLVDTARGQGFIEFRMTSEVPEAPACGETVTEPEVVSDREGVMTGFGTGTPTSTATVTLAEYTATGEACAEVILVDDSDSTTADTPVDVDVVGNDTIPEGSSAPDVDTTTAEGGTVTDNGDGTVTYTPPAGFLGTDTFTYRVTGPDGVEHEATVTITVTDDDEPPVPMVAPGLAVAGLLGAGLLAAVRRRTGKES